MRILRTKSYIFHKTKLILAILLKNGYMGKILKADLSTWTLKVEPTSEDIAKKYLGGKGYAVYLLYQI
jgi:hypothetical protein